MSNFPLPYEQLPTRYEQLPTKNLIIMETKNGFHNKNSYQQLPTLIYEQLPTRYEQLPTRYEQLPTRYEQLPTLDPLYRGASGGAEEGIRQLF